MTGQSNKIFLKTRGWGGEETEGHRAIDLIDTAAGDRTRNLQCAELSKPRCLYRYSGYAPAIGTVRLTSGARGGSVEFDRKIVIITAARGLPQIRWP